MSRRLIVLAAGCSVVLAGCVQITPNKGLVDGQAVSVSISEFAPGSKVWLSECAPSQVPATATGCASSLAGQPSLVLDAKGNGHASFTVRKTVGGVSCGAFCTVVATDTHRLQTATIGFSGPGELTVGNGLAGRPMDLYSDGRLVGTVQDFGSAPSVTLPAGTHQVALRSAGAAATSKPLVAGPTTVTSGARTSGVGRHVATTAATTVTSTEAPAPPPEDMVRVRWVNTTTIPLTVTLAGHRGPTLAPGQSTDMTEPGEPGVPPGDDSWAEDYPSPVPGQPLCGMGNAGGILRGVGTVITLTPDTDIPQNRECPHRFYDVRG